MIAERRKLEIKEPAAGSSTADLENNFPCFASINAFGLSPIAAQMTPPHWFNDNTNPREWTVSPYTIATWPYEEVYRYEVLNTETKYPKYDPVKRRNAVNEYFSKIKPGASLIFYYTNYSNPLSEIDQQGYVVVGMSRIKSIGKERAIYKSEILMHLKRSHSARSFIPMVSPKN